MSYQFTDTPTPAMPLRIVPPANDVDLVEGSPQVELISTAFSGTTVAPTLVPPTGWTLTNVSWSSGNGIFTIPNPGAEDTYTFDYTVSQAGGASKSNTGVFKIKRAGGF